MYRKRWTSRKKASSFLFMTHLLLRGPKIMMGLKVSGWTTPLLSHLCHYLQNQKSVLDESPDVLLPPAPLLFETLVNSKL